MTEWSQHQTGPLCTDRRRDSLRTTSRVSMTWLHVGGFDAELVIGGDLTDTCVLTWSRG
jgi:hypothetical protein